MHEGNLIISFVKDYTIMCFIDSTIKGLRVREKIVPLRKPDSVCGDTRGEALGVAPCHSFKLFFLVSGIVYQYII